MASFIDYKKASEQAMYHLLARAQEEKRISPEEAKAAHAFIRHNIEKPKTHANIVHFLGALNQKWPIFGQLLYLEKEKLSKVRYEAKVEKAEANTASPKIDVKTLEKQMLEIIIAALEAKKFTEEESQQAAQFILSEIDEIYDQADIIIFVKKLTAKWPVFAPLVEIEAGKISRQKENVAADQIATLIKTGQAGQATTMAHKVIQG